MASKKLFIFLTLAGCYLPESSVESSSAALVGATASPDTDNAVVFLAREDDLSEPSCTGTLVTSRHVLTARHCVSALADENITCSSSGSATSGRFGVDHDPSTIRVFVGQSKPAKLEDALAKGKAIVHDKATYLCGHDIALLELDRPIATVVPATIDLNMGVQTDQTVSQVGWGITEDGAASVRRRRDGIRVIAVGPYEGHGKIPAMPASEFRVSEGTCMGDSGGPVFDEATGALIGVVSRGGNGTNGIGAGACTKGTFAVVNVGSFEAIKSLLAENSIASPAPADVSTPTGCSLSAGQSTGVFLPLAIVFGTLLAARRPGAPRSTRVGK